MWRGAIASFLAFLFTCSIADAEDRASIYRETYPCKEGSPKSTCIVGTIPRGAPVTLITKDQVFSAKPLRELPDQIFASETATGTLLQTEKSLPRAGGIIAIIAPANTISVIKQEAQNDPELVSKVDKYLEKMSHEFKDWVGHRWLNPHFSTRVIGLTPNVKIAEVKVRMDDGAYVPDKGAMEVTCTQCTEETITLLVHDDVFELFDRGDTLLCSRLISALRLSGRIHIYSTADGCQNGVYIAQVQEVSESGPPLLVFRSSFFSN
jgi:hypothetical protein